MDEPTPGELFRRLDALDRSISDVRAAVASLPTAALIEAREQRLHDRADRNEKAIATLRSDADRDLATLRADAERDSATLRASVEALVKALDAERDTRVKAIQDEALARVTAIAAEKRAVGVRFRWVLSVGATVLGGVVASLFGVHIGGK